MNLRLVLAIAVAGGMGTALRYVLTNFVERSLGGSFPLGTLLVNVLGCTAMGAVLGYFGPTAQLSPWRPIIATGILGGLTTFSAYAAEIGTSLQRGQMGTAALLLVLHHALGVGCLLIGYTAFVWSGSMR